MLRRAGQRRAGVRGGRPAGAAERGDGPAVRAAAVRHQAAGAHPDAAGRARVHGVASAQLSFVAVAARRCAGQLIVQQSEPAELGHAQIALVSPAAHRLHAALTPCIDLTMCFVTEHRSGVRHRLQGACAVRRGCSLAAGRCPVPVRLRAAVINSQTVLMLEVTWHQGIMHKQYCCSPETSAMDMCLHCVDCIRWADSILVTMG